MMRLKETKTYTDQTKPVMLNKLKVILFCAVIILCVYPFESTVVPTWKLRVIDEAGQPYVGKQVNQGYKNYSLDLAAGDYGEYKFTDDDGYVNFPKRTIRAPLFWRIIAPIIATVMTIAHGGTGIHAYLFTSWRDGQLTLLYKPGEPLPTEMIVPR